MVVRELEIAVFGDSFAKSIWKEWDPKQPWLLKYRQVEEGNRKPIKDSSNDDIS